MQQFLRKSRELRETGIRINHTSSLFSPNQLLFMSCHRQELINNLSTDVQVIKEFVKAKLKYNKPSSHDDKEVLLVVMTDRSFFSVEAEDQDGLLRVFKIDGQDDMHLGWKVFDSLPLMMDFISDPHREDGNKSNHDTS